MPKIQSFACPSCGAALSIEEGKRYLRCQYCGRNVKYNPTLQIPPKTITKPKISPTPPQKVNPYPLVATRSKGHLASYLIMFLVLSGVGASLFFSTMGSKIFQGIVSAKIQWHASGQPPIPVSINGDEIEDVIGIFREYQSSGNFVFYVGAFDGKNFSKLWHVGPFGDISQGRHTRFAVTSQHVLVTDYRMNAHVYELKSGKEIHTISLSDRAEQVCSSPGNAAVWLQLADKKEVLLDLLHATLEPQKRPIWCKDLKKNGDCSYWYNVKGSECLTKKQIPVIDGFAAKYALKNDNNGIAIGTRSPGTQIPMVVGFALLDNNIVFSRPIPSRDPLLAKESAPKIAEVYEGVVYVVYEMSSGVSRVQALDSQSGQILWDVKLADTDRVSNIEALVLSPSRVYVPHWTWLDILDRKTGKFLGRIGSW